LVVLVVEVVEVVLDKWGLLVLLQVEMVVMVFYIQFQELRRIMVEVEVEVEPVQQAGVWVD
jgi:hypothetical protein